MIHIPNKWREGKVLFIPISLSSFILKILGRLIDIYLCTSLVANNQQAYMEGRSADRVHQDVIRYTVCNFRVEEFIMTEFLLRQCES